MTDQRTSCVTSAFFHRTIDAARWPLRGGWLVVALVLVGLCNCGPPPRPNVVLVTLDTTRADHMSCYGYARPTTPNLDRLASEGVLYTRAWSTSSWTLPAHASLFTGFYPSSHGARFDAHGEEKLLTIRVGTLGDDFITMAELLADRGYRTGAFIGGPFLKPAFGLMQGFEHVGDAVEGFQGVRAGALTDDAAEWLAKVPQQEPFFLFINYFDPHAPYDPPAEFDLFSLRRGQPAPERLLDAIAGGDPLSDTERSQLIDSYDGEIRATDHHFGRLLQTIRARDNADGTLVIVTADHGESFGEEGRYLHNGWLSEEQVRVPLIVVYPDGRRAGVKDASAIQLVDVLPLVAAEVSIELPSDTQGIYPGRRSEVFLELYRSAFNVKHFGPQFDRDLEAVITWPLKLVVSSDETHSFYRLRDWTEEPTDEAGDGSVQSLTQLIEAHREASVETPTQIPVVDKKTADALKALGYVD